jgi:hypothetical protein
MISKQFRDRLWVPYQVGLEFQRNRLWVRADAGYFDATLAHTAVTAGCDFAIAAKRNPAA